MPRRGDLPAAPGHLCPERDPAGKIRKGRRLRRHRQRPAPGTAFDPGDQISGIVLPGFASSAIAQNFGERVPSSGAPISSGWVAAAVFQHNKHRQALVIGLNGGPSATQLGGGLAASFPNMYGVSAGPNNLTVMTNLQVARFYQSLFSLNGKTTVGGPPRLDFRVMSMAVAAYVANSTLAGRTAAAYGFVVTEGGARTALYNVGGSSDASGVESNSDVAILDLLLATDERTVGGILYDVDGNEEIDGWEMILRHIAHDLYSPFCGSG